MSWASHNPEKWDEICETGIMWKLRHPANIGGNRFDDDEVLEALQEAMECHAIKLALCDWASKEIAEAESSYFADMVDHTYESRGATP